MEEHLKIDHAQATRMFRAREELTRQKDEERKELARQKDAARVFQAMQACAQLVNSWGGEQNLSPWVACKISAVDMQHPTSKAFAASLESRGFKVRHRVPQYRRIGFLRTEADYDLLIVSL